ncbi:MAG TPA: glutamate synthase large subunit [Saprospiraceae bacterium]|nr:glutamate synthase large subunit [Saprospiraceae bacterium]
MMMNGGLYVPQMEKSSCGIGMIAHLAGVKSHQLVADALTILENMVHRGACGYEENSGDGAGILTQIPHELFFNELSSSNIDLGQEGTYGIGFLFLPKNETDKKACKEIISSTAEEYGFNVIIYRCVPTDHSELGLSARQVEPDMEQVFLKSKEHFIQPVSDRKLYLLRNVISNRVYTSFPHLRDDFYICSLSSKTIVYKGQLTALQLRNYYPDLSNEEYRSSVALIHSRFSTNTIPKWKLAQPFRMIAHNGEINTIRSNTNNWRAREKTIYSNVFGEEELKSITPICDPHLSDSGNFDNVLEFLVMNGRSIPHSIMMMIPEAWHEDPLASEEKKMFYRFHEMIMEPWDGPASICFTDGQIIGATLDRNGLRPSRYCLTSDGLLILASESGVFPIPPEKVVKKGRLQPGKILLANLGEGHIIMDDLVKDQVISQESYRNWIEKNTLHLDDTLNHDLNSNGQKTGKEVKLDYKLAFGFSREDEEIILQSMGKYGEEPVGSMGADIPLPILSTTAQHVSNYFKQEFAQVTNPPIDPLRERVYMSLHTFLGPAIKLHRSIESRGIRLLMASPVLSKSQFTSLINHTSAVLDFSVLESVFPCNEDNGILEQSIDLLCIKALKSIESNRRLLILDNTQIDEKKVAIPSLIACGALHQFLINEGKRKEVSIVVKGADVWETHHFATLLSFGADAIYPEMALNIISGISEDNSSVNPEKKYIKAVEKGLLKVMSKLGISTMASYKGSQTFEALGIHPDVMKKCFTYTVSRIGGMTFDMLAREQWVKHRAAFFAHVENLPDLGVYQWKVNGEYHLFNPKSIHLLQYSTACNDYKMFRQYSTAIDEQEKKACTLRSFFTYKKDINPIPLSEVEPAENILKRFATGAMSFGSISYEAHTTLAIAMNRIGGKSNSGEGGEDEIRYQPDANGENLSSAIKQVASGRFGVTIQYLAQAREIQIKMAQGAKPGEGGQLPGHKVDDWIGRVRHSTPGVGLISPPPHHDIYSIEDLAQLIFDLKNANPNARISVKLVSKAGVGIIASGVAKAHADHILISGADGGTGASPLSSIRHAGLPLELGLAETHQTLVKNNLRNRVTLQADGQIRTGRDLAIATMLGAEEWGIATAALVVEGCILMRKCHLNTCPVGIATQDTDLRKKFSGKAENLVNFFHFLAHELREIMASLGIRTVNELVGRSDLLQIRKDLNHWKWRSVDLQKVLYREKNPLEISEYKSIDQEHGLNRVLDKELIRYAGLALQDKISINSVFSIRSTDRAVGTMLSHEIVKRYGKEGLEPDSISFRFRGSAGQSFGAFAIRGLKLILEGDANDYLGKGLSGAKMVIVPDRNATLDPSENIIIGNVAFYGATSGEAYVRGMAGDRFCVRNSGAHVVVEGIGDNGCEYMTGGSVVILGRVGRNFSAGMSGGVAFIYDPDPAFYALCNRDMVVLENPSRSDMESIRSRIRNHFQYTGSVSALEILGDWETKMKLFLKVIPTDYKKILERIHEKPGEILEKLKVNS